MDDVPRIKAMQDTIKKAKDSSATPELKARAAVLPGVINAHVKSSLKLLDRVRDLNPNEWRTPYFAAQYFSEVGLNAKAESTLVAARGKSPNEGILVRALGDFYTRDGKAQKALSLYDSAQKNPYLRDDSRILEGQAMTFAEVGKFEEAMAVVERASKDNPNDQRLGMLRNMIQSRLEAARHPAAPTGFRGMPGVAPAEEATPAQPTQAQ